MATPNITGGIGIPNVTPRNLEQAPAANEQNPRYFDINTGGIGNSFANMLSDAIEGVDSSMKASETAVQDFVTGKSENVHDVMISMQKAQLSFQMMVEVRNKVIETYQEISRMQV